jgi:hypothetical protein
MARFRQSLLVLTAAALAPLFLRASGPLPVFLPDDPMQVMPTPKPVTKVSTHKIDQVYDFLVNSVPRNPPPPVPAGGVPTAPGLRCATATATE